MNHEILDLVKSRNTQIFKDICIQISHLVFQNSAHTVIQPGKSLDLNLQKISVIFLKLILDKKQAPLSLFLKDFVGESDSSDIQLFYSFTNPYPCEGELGVQNDGYFLQ
jgi:hypothetical protein